MWLWEEEIYNNTESQKFKVEKFATMIRTISTMLCTDMISEEERLYLFGGNDDSGPDLSDLHIKDG